MMRVESFEYLAVGEGLALLRLAGEWEGEAPASVRLLAWHAGGEHELLALPEPPSDGEDPLWRSAYSAPTELLDGSASFRLAVAEGVLVELPAPVERGAAGPAPPPAAEEPSPDPAPEPEPVGTGESIVALERTLERERARHERAEASLRAQLEALVGETAEFMGRLEGYELRRAELEKELSWERLLHRETRRTKEEAERERDEAREQLAALRERNASFSRRLREQERLLGAARGVAEDGSSRLADLEDRILRLRNAAERIPATAPDRNGHEPALVAEPDQVEALQRALADAEAGAERLAELERRVGDLRSAVMARRRAATTPSPAPPGARRRRLFAR